jgi:hypothetical protein
MQPGADEPAAPSPEAARSTMAAIQLGWQRGRSVIESAEPEPAVPADSGGSASLRDTEPAAPADDTTPASDIEPAGDTEPDGDAEAASDEFRTTQSPKLGGDREDEGGAE